MKKLTVLQYAEKHNKSRSIIQRLIRQGRIKSDYINGQYFIDEDFPFPEDLRKSENRKPKTKKHEINSTEFISVEEFSKIHDKDPAAIRQHIRRGTLEAVKMGKIYLIHRDTAYPEDRRLLSGIYKDWRKKKESED